MTDKEIKVTIESAPTGVEHTPVSKFMAERIRASVLNMQLEKTTNTFTGNVNATSTIEKYKAHLALAELDFKIVLVEKCLANLNEQRRELINRYNLNKD